MAPNSISALDTVASAGYYWGSTNTSATAGSILLTDAATGGYLQISGESLVITDSGSAASFKVKKKGVSPIIAFKMIKRKLNLIHKKKYTKIVVKLEKLIKKYTELGHHALSEKFTNRIKEELVLAELAMANIKYWIHKDVVSKYRHNIYDGHISDTPFDEFTRVIPDRVLKKKKECDQLKIFTDYVIYHYWNEEAAKDVESMSSNEKAKMRDPILFGLRKDSPGKLFFIADWDDDYCTLRFEDLVEALDEKIEEDEEDWDGLETRLPKLTESSFSEWYKNTFGVSTK